MTSQKNIVLLSPKKGHAQDVAQQLTSEYGLKCVNAEKLNLEKSAKEENMVILCDSSNTTTDLKALGYVANLSDYPAENIEETTTRIFDEACESFLGHLTLEELAPCA